MPGKSVREALLVLLHHSLVLFEEPCSTEPPAHTTYRLDTNAVLSRLGLSSILAAVKAESPACEALLFDIVAKGKLPTSDANTGALDTLLNEGLVEYVTDDMCRFSSAPDPEAAAPSNGGASAKRKPATPQTPGPAAPAKRASPAQAAFVRLRTKAALFRYVVGAQLRRLAVHRINDAAGHLLACIWRLAAREGAFAGAASSWTFSTAQLQPLAKGLDLPVEAGTAPRTSALGHYLVRLCLEFSDFLAPSQLSATGSAYVLSLAAALDHLRLLQIEAFVAATFGRPSARCYRIVREQRMVEDRHVARLAMMPGKEVRERLFQLMRVGLVQMQEVPRTADHAPARTIFLWTIKHTPSHPPHRQPSAYFQAFGSRLASALLNLRVLALHERTKHLALLDKVERTDVAGNLALLSDSEQQQLADLRRILLVLDIKGCHLFSDFWTMTAST